ARQPSAAPSPHERDGNTPGRGAARHLSPEDVAQIDNPLAVVIESKTQGVVLKRLDIGRGDHGQILREWIDRQESIVCPGSSPVGTQLVPMLTDPLDHEA